MSRCIFCMNQTEGQDQVCPVCHRGIWEYRWDENNLEPYTRLREKYLVGSVIEKDGESTCYLGYDLILEQRLRIYEYPIPVWEKSKRRMASLLFEQLSLPGLAAVRDYFTENKKGYMVASFPEGITLQEYLHTEGKIRASSATQILLPVMHTVTGLHARGLVHGNLTPKHLIIAEDGTVQILPDCREGSMEGDAGCYTPQELMEEDGIVGPWTDIYSAGAIWYEMVTGRPPDSVARRKKKDRLKRPSRYTQVSQREEKVWMQALSLDPQLRFFCFGNLLECLEIEGQPEEKNAGTIRNIWGEAWLKIAQRVDGQKKSGRKRYLLRRFAAAAAVAVCLSGVLAGGLCVYVRTHQPEYFAWKLDREREQADKRYVTGVYEKDDPDYEKIREFVLQYGSEDEEEMYEIDEKYLKRCPAQKGTYKSFYIKYDTAKSAVEYYMDIKGKVDLEKSLNHIYADFDGKKDSAIQINANKRETYKVRGKGEEITFAMDPLDQSLISVEYQGSQERCERFLEKMLPLLTPETVLTRKEIQEFLRESSEDGKYSRVNLNARYILWLHDISEVDGSDSRICSVEVMAAQFECSDLTKVNRKAIQDTISYAGNYARGSSKYQEFVSYLEEHAVSKKENEDADGTVYTLEEKDVLAWGEPCNNFRFFQKDEEILQELKESGYRMEKVSQNCKNTVEIQKYGAIVTNFNVVEHYQMKDGIYLAILRDLVNRDIMQMVVYREKGTDVQLGQAAADVAEQVGILEKEERKILPEELLKASQKAEKEEATQFIEVGNLLFMNMEYKNTGIAIYMVPGENVGGQLNYWP